MIKRRSTAESYDKDTHISFFELACKTPGCHKFIGKCIKIGCIVNKVENGTKIYKMMYSTKQYLYF